MQTFLPYPSFRWSARVLDPDRLGNQFYNEGMTLARGNGWSHHPAFKMWIGYERHLCRYLEECYLELLSRDLDYSEHLIELDDIMARYPEDQPEPWWLGDDRLHSTHRAALLFKDYDYYRAFGWSEQPEFDYWWPV